MNLYYQYLNYKDERKKELEADKLTNLIYFLALGGGLTKEKLYAFNRFGKYFKGFNEYRLQIIKECKKYLKNFEDKDDDEYLLYMQKNIHDVADVFSFKTALDESNYNFASAGKPDKSKIKCIWCLMILSNFFFKTPSLLTYLNESKTVIDTLAEKWNIDDSLLMEMEEELEELEYFKQYQKLQKKETNNILQVIQNIPWKIKFNRDYKKIIKKAAKLIKCDWFAGYTTDDRLELFSGKTLQYDMAKGIEMAQTEFVDMAEQDCYANSSGKPSRTQMKCLWLFSLIAYYFEKQTENTKKIIKKYAKKWNVKSGIILELQDTAETFKSLNEHKDWLILKRKNRKYPKRYFRNELSEIFRNWMDLNMSIHFLINEQEV